MYMRLSLSASQRNGSQVMLSLGSRAFPAQTIETAVLGGDEDLGAVVAVEVGQHGLAHGAAQRNLPEDAGF